jgi:hypothetical protein
MPQNKSQKSSGRSDIHHKIGSGRVIYLEQTDPAGSGIIGGFFDALHRGMAAFLDFDHCLSVQPDLDGRAASTLIPQAHVAGSREGMPQTVRALASRYSLRPAARHFATVRAERTSPETT